MTADMISPGTVVIDVGSSRAGEKLVGDVDFAAVRKVAEQLRRFQEESDVWLLRCYYTIR